MSSSIALEMSPRLRPKPGFPVAEALLGFSVFVAACISIFLTRAPGGIALIWPCSAIAGAVLIRLPQVRWIAAAVFTFTSLALASIMAAHRPWPIAAAFSAVNLFEIALMVVAFRFVWRFPYPNITIEHAAWMTALFGIWIPAVSRREPACPARGHRGLLPDDPQRPLSLRGHRVDADCQRIPHGWIRGLPDESRLRIVDYQPVDCRHPAHRVGFDDPYRGHSAGSAGDCLSRDHDAADRCRLGHAVRNSDTVARLGGDEFAIILENCGTVHAGQVARQVLRALNPLAIEWEGQSYSVNASLGLAMISDRMTDEKAWLENADKACYQAKNRGRSQLISL